jgi:hypothetical protein
MATTRKYKKKAIPVGCGVLTKWRRTTNAAPAKLPNFEANGEKLLKAKRRVAECSLDIYFLRETITEPQYVAGMIFRRAYQREIQGEIVRDVGSGPCGGPSMAIITSIYAQQILRQAYAQLSLEQLTVVIAVCGNGQWAGGQYRFRLLQSGLAALARKWPTKEMT